MAQQDATLKRIAGLMREIDFCMFTTSAHEGGMYAQPMSNNRKVEFDGDVWFFSGTETRKVREIERDPQVHQRGGRTPSTTISPQPVGSSRRATRRRPSSPRAATATAVALLVGGRNSRLVGR